MIDYCYECVYFYYDVFARGCCAFPDESVNVVGNYNKACKRGKEKS